MRRNRDDKRVLYSPRNNSGRDYKRPKTNKPPHQRRRGKTNRITVFVIILALIAFVIGAGAGISLTFDDGDEGPQWHNVTEEMTTNLTGDEKVYFDEDLDQVDFNNNETLTELNITKEPSY